MALYKVLKYGKFDQTDLFPKTTNRFLARVIETFKRLGFSQAHLAPL